MQEHLKQAVVLAGGKSSRFVPYNSYHSKLASDLLGKPIITWTLDTLRASEVEQIVVVRAAGADKLIKIVEDYQQHHSQLDLNMVVQDKPNGQADAILTARDFLAEKFMVINGSHFDVDQFLSLAGEIETKVGLFSQATDQPRLYGILEIAEGRAVGLTEKPDNASIPAQRLVSCYLLSRRFIEFMSQMDSSEYLLESALNRWMRKELVSVKVIDHNSPSLKYPWHLLDLKNILLDRAELAVSPKASVAKTAAITGKVHIGPKAVVGDYAVVEGPAFIGAEAVVGRYCTLRGRSVIEAGAEIQGYGDINNSVLMKDAHVHSGFVGDSIVGESTRIGAGFTTANKRLDRAAITAEIGGRQIDTGRAKLGAVIGHQAKIGVKVSTMPGVIIANQVHIYPHQLVDKNYQS